MDAVRALYNKTEAPVLVSSGNGSGSGSGVGIAVVQEATASLPPAVPSALYPGRSSGYDMPSIYAPKRDITMLLGGALVALVVFLAMTSPKRPRVGGF